MTTGYKPGELAPVGDRLRWMLRARSAFGALIIAMAATLSHFSGHQIHGGPAVWLALAVGWPALTSLTLLVRDQGRGLVRFSLTASLLGDGVLLAFGWWATGALMSPVAYLVVLHGVAVTLLASFRTGVKLAVWHTILAWLVLEAVRAELLPGVEQANALDRWLYFGAMWAAVIGTASFAASNERELRRRRYDSEALQQFGATLVAQTEPLAVASALAMFANSELAARRAVVVLRARTATNAGFLSRPVMVVAEGDGITVSHPDPSRMGTSVVAAAIALGQTLLRPRFDPERDPSLTEVMPGARGLIIVPIAMEQAVGALVVQMGVASLWARQVERRAVNTAEQAASQAASALQVTVLTEQLRAQSQTDGLTGVANRRRFDEVFAARVSQAAENGADLALLLVDIDHFKRLNDTHGHQAGDETLREVAQALHSQCQEPHLVARYGGEEFGIVLADTDPVGALAIAERVRGAVARIEGVTQVTASIGVASYPGHGLSPAELISGADAALYRAKASGRNRVRSAEAPNMSHPHSVPAQENPSGRDSLRR
ncbi:GGDEF domain-containing protein [Pilimelia columellifera]|uniref:GGDEF domain-containing protein n=1 Tax=Pilimelia columellifera subsp. columellifera TaxID=706583 RepID=A0ABN3NIG8_9ACTN